MNIHIYTYMNIHIYTSIYLHTCLYPVSTERELLDPRETEGALRAVRFLGIGETTLEPAKQKEGLRVNPILNPCWVRVNP